MPDGLDGGLAAARWQHMAPALRYRNFRLFWSGQVVSIIGTSLQVVAEGWLIYRLTGSTFWLGMVGFLALIPVVPISFLGGVLIDRFPRRKLILATQIGLLIQSAVFGLLALSARLQLWHIILLYSAFGALLAVDHPARRAFLVELVDREALANAVALNGAVFNIASFVGYAASGFLIATIGAGGTMLTNAASYLATIAALLAIHVPDTRHDTSSTPLSAAWKEGIEALLRQPVMIGVIALMAVVGGLAYPVTGMMPALAAEVLGTGAVGLGLLWAASALGAVIGTVVVARVGVRRRGKTLTLASCLLPMLVFGVSRAKSMPAAAVMLVAVGMGLLVLQSLAITLVQVNIPDRIRGRVMSLYSQIHAGSDTASNMLVGAVATKAGLPLTLALAALAALVFAAVWSAALPAVRRLD